MIRSGYSDMNEAKNLGTLYHFTPLRNLVQIINSNKLTASDCDDLATGVSLTRDKNHIRHGTYGKMSDRG